jgi:hypothetical protein
VRDPAKVVVVELQDERYDALIIEVAHPAAAVACSKMPGALGRGGGRSSGLRPRAVARSPPRAVRGCCGAEPV